MTSISYFFKWNSASGVQEPRSLLWITIALIDATQASEKGWSMEFFNSTNWRLCMSMHEKSSISYLAGSQRTSLYRIIGIPWLCPVSQLHWPGPSHKARQLAWKYSRGASWPNYFLYKSLMSLTSIPIYIYIGHDALDQHHLHVHRVLFRTYMTTSSISSIIAITVCILCCTRMITHAWCMTCGVHAVFMFFFIYLRTHAVTSSLSQLQRCETRAKVAAPTGYALCSRLLGQGPVKPIWKRLILALYINLYIFLHVQMFDIYEFPKSNSFMSLVQWSTLTIQEELVTSVFRENGMYYPVKIETVTSKPLDSLNFPWIPPSSFIRAMGANNDLGHILGGHTLKEARGMLETFWSRYRAIYPKHGLWSDVDSHKKTLHRCIQKKWTTCDQLSGMHRVGFE